jgi:signal peptidase I
MTDVADTQPEAADKQPPSLKNEAIDTVKTVGIFLLIVLVLRIFIFQPFTIPSRSMMPNLLVGDYIIVTKGDYGYSRASIPFNPPLFRGRLFERRAKRGDIIVFKTPAEGHKDLIKRLVGLPGDRIQVRGGVVYVNEQELTRVADGSGPSEACPNRATPQRFRETNLDGRSYQTYDCGTGGDLDDTPVYRVPDGHYFFMGDNRDNSVDSRVDPAAGGVGYVPAENLVGRARFVGLSWEEGASLFKPWTWFTDARVSRFFKGLK